MPYPKVLSSYHRLSYAGVDLSSLSVASSAHQDATKIHASSSCRWVPWRSRSAGTMRPIDVHATSASKACPHCFDKLVTDSKFADYDTLVSAFTSDDANFLRTAFAKKSKRITPEDAVPVIRRLTAIRTEVDRVRNHLTDAHQHVFAAADGLVDRLDQRINSMRVLGQSEGLEEKFLREAYAFAATLDPHSDKAFKRFCDTASGGSMECKETIQTVAVRWVEMRATEQLVSAALVNQLVKSAHFRYTSQLDFRSDGLPSSHLSLKQLVMDRWSREVSTRAAALVESWNQAYDRLSAVDTTSFAMFDVPGKYNGVSAKIDERVTLGVVDKYQLHRDGSRVFLMMPTGMLGAVKGATDYYYDQRYLKALTVSDARETLSMASSLFGVGTEFNTLELALAAARSLD